MDASPALVPVVIKAAAGRAIMKKRHARFILTGVIAIYPLCHLNMSEPAARNTADISSKMRICD
jgi:hypothetical protein